MTDLSALSASYASIAALKARTAGPAISPSTAAGGKKEAQAAVAKACEELESIFVEQLFKSMRATVPQNGLFGGGKAEVMYTEMLDAQMARDVAHKGGFGLARMMAARTAEIEKKGFPPAPGSDASDHRPSAPGPAAGKDPKGDAAWKSTETTP